MARLALMCAAMLAASFGAAAEDYRAEAEQLAREIVEIHPRGAEIAKSEAFIAARAALFAIAGDSNLPQYAMAAGRMFHAADDGHTAVIPVYGEAPAFTWRYPIRLKRFEDGLYVVAATGAAEPLLGAKLTRVGGRRVNEVLRAFVLTQARGNRAWPTNWTALGLTIPGFLIGLDVAPADLEAPVRFEGTAQGKRVSALLTAAADGADNLTEIAREASPLEGLGGGAVNFAAEIDEGRALLLVIGAMEDSETKSFEAFTAEAAAALEATQAGRVVIDLRDNGGGNNMLCEPLRRILVKSRFNRPGGIYVLTASQTFSAAMNFATRLERETDALFVGEPTGGAPNHFGDAKFAHGPQSGLPYIISTLRWQDSTPFDERPWILPDLAAPPRFDLYVAGRDGALERALANPAGDDPLWWRRAMEPWARETQKADWRYFYED
ncbi:MAG: hypothetical protein WD076_10835 [Parvularculaceae bacterium]